MSEFHQTPSEYLRSRIYPDLDKALIQLIEHVSKTNLIIQHQEHLIEQKTLDKIEQKRIEKEKLKKELGSAYESSEESGFEDDFRKEEEIPLENALNSEKDLKDEEKGENLKESAENLMKISKEDNFETKKNKFGMMIIEEGDEGMQDDELNPKKPELDEKTRYEIALEKRRKEFNPVKFLGERLKALSQSKG